MRKLMELVMIMVFCISIASGSTIMIISDTGYWPAGGSPLFPNVDGDAEYQDSSMVDYLKSLGYTVDTSGMAGAYRETTGWTTNQGKLAALNAADLIILSRETSSGSYDNDRKAWNELAVPILNQNVHLARSGGKLGWFNGGPVRDQTGALSMDIVMGHELVNGFSDPVTVFTLIPGDPWNPSPDADWDSYTSIIGTFENAPMLVDIPTGTDFDAVCGTTDYYGISGARRVYLGIYTYGGTTADDAWIAGLTDDYKDLFAQLVDQTMNSTVKIVNDSPAHNATDILVDITEPVNDLVFTILDPNVVEVDVYLGTEGDPNLAQIPEFKIVDGMSVTPGQYTVDLEGVLTENLSWYTDYYWKVIGLEPNAVTSIPEPATAGPTWTFQTEPEAPIISGVSPSITAALPGDPNVIFSVEGINIETYQWYKDGVGALSNGVDYSGVDTDTLVINDIDEDDFGSYYCVGSRTGFDPVTSVPYGVLEKKELKHHFEFNSADLVGDITPDSIAGVQAQLIHGASVVTGPDPIVGDYLRLNNPIARQQPISSAQYADIQGPVFDHKNITITAWYSLAQIDEWQPLFGTGGGEDDYLILATTYKGNSLFADAKYPLDPQNTEEQEIRSPPYDPNVGQWYFVALTVAEDGEGKLYLDGQFAATDNLFDITNIDMVNNYIGRAIYEWSSGTLVDTIDGRIDELKIYNYVLSDVQIAQEYLAVRGGFVCSEDYDLQAYDYDHNCRVDLVDIAEFSTRWLEHDRIYRP